MENKYDISQFVDVLTDQQVICNLVNRYIAVRKRMKITQKELSKRSNVSYASIRRFESTGEISFISLIKIAGALDCLEDFESLFSNKKITSVKEIYYDKRNR